MEPTDRLELTLPRGWRDLTQKQLSFIYALLAGGLYTLTEVKTFTMFKFLGIKLISGGETSIIKIKSQIIELSALEMAVWINELQWIGEFSPVPVRLIGFGKRKAVSSTLSDITLSEYIVLDNLYQGYLQTMNRKLLFRMGNILYPGKGKISSSRRHEYELNIFYWYTSFKIWAADRWSHFFQPAVSGSGKQPPSERKIREAIDAQIRALTKGDITKEKEIMQMPCHRAFTELDALAEESERIRKMK